MPGGNIKVVVRVRPFNSRELGRKAKCIVRMEDGQTVLQPPVDAEERLRLSRGSKGADGQKTFAFDKSYWSFNHGDPHFAGQDSLFNDLGAPLLDNAFQGYNNCIFAYGQTGSGKSYSMMGYGEEPGVIPRICQDMFERITQIQEDKNYCCTVEVSYLEIYNERVRDLLNPSTKGNLKVREHPSTGPYVEDLAKLVVRSFPEIQHLMDEGNKARTVAATNMNETSSRSHAVFTLTVTQKRHDVETGMDTEKVAKISLVDLAGSERATSTGATGARLKEGAEINRSLSTLGRVIATLADISTGKKKNMSMVPYRDSVLTWLLKDSLGGNSLTAMIAAISPADINFEETLSTLRYADSAKRIKNHAVVNEDPNARMIRELKEELAQLRSKLGSGATAGGVAEEQYASDVPLDMQIVSITQADGSIKKVSKADIAEQLNQSEKLYMDLNQTWEEKLQKTEQIHKERESALEELGISIEKGFVGVSTPKKMPHLVNLSDDPLLTECLVYNIKPGTTTVSNVEDLGTSSEIRLNGSKILREHCTFENVDGLVTITPRDGAAIMVNGLRIEKPKRLRSGNRIILGDFHIFRFNHPQEARVERAEQSLLRHSVTTSQLGSPAPPPSHERALSRTESEIDGDFSRSDSPMPSNNGRDSDWSFARREAANAILGADQKIADLTDDELTSLFDDVQRARAVRQGRPGSRLFGRDDEDMESVSSYPVREKYMSNGTLDNFSLDTAITMPGTPLQSGDELLRTGVDALQLVRDNMQAQLDKQKDEYIERLRLAESSSAGDLQELQHERAQMEAALLMAKEEFQAKLLEQREAFDAQLQQIMAPICPRRAADSTADSVQQNKEVAMVVIERWRRLRHVRMAEVILQNAALLKEAQILSHEMDKPVSFQFAVVKRGQESCSSYDLVISGISGEDDDNLDDAPKPCIAVRVVDYQHELVHLWSVEKFERRLQVMRQMHQYISRPDYLQHFRLENPFTEACMLQYSLIGDISVPLAAVFEARVQDYTVEIVSPYTQETIAVSKLSLEPSSAQVPSSMLKFNVVMHDVAGFAEREGTNLHARISVPCICDDGGATTTQTVCGFEEGAARFESVHSMSIPSDVSHDISLRVAVYAKVTPMHLDKLLSWDEMREAGEGTSEHDRGRKLTRLAEREYYVQEDHDVFGKVQILEMSEAGEYVAVDVEQHTNADPGTYQLRQGLQRRIVLSLSCASGESLEWGSVNKVRIGNIRLLEPRGSTSAVNKPSSEIALKLLQDPNTTSFASGTQQVTAIGQWDSSLHVSALLDRPTREKNTVQMTISVDIPSARLNKPMTFSFANNVQVRPRSWLRPQSLFKQLWSTTRIVHSTNSIFSVTLKPALTKSASDLWRMDSKNTYVKGEEHLRDWKPRGVSLIDDFLRSQRKRQLIAEVETTKVFLTRYRRATTSAVPKTDALSARQQSLLQKSITLWLSPSHHTSIPTLRPSTACPPTPPTTPPRLTATILPVPLNPRVLKSGPLLTPSPPPSLTWQRRFAELRYPYLHLYSVPDGEALSIINLRNARIDMEPEVRGLLRSEKLRGNVFAVYGGMCSWLFAARSVGEKERWVGVIEGNGVGEGE